MNFPRPDLQEYARFTVTALLTLAFLQYTGIFYENAGAVNLRFLIGVGITLPIFLYNITLVTGNVNGLKNYGEINRTGE
jgi:hypothetical protein